MSTSPESCRSSRHGRVNAALLAVVLTAAIFVIVWALVVHLMGGNEGPAEFAAVPPRATFSDRPEDQAFENATRAQSGGADTAATATTTCRVIPDDGKSLWLPPTEGPPISLDFAPGGGQLFLHLRPASLLSQAEGRRALQALGPRFATARAAWESATRLPLNRTDELLLVYVPGPAAPKVVAILRPAEGVDWEPPGPYLGGDASASVDDGQQVTYLTKVGGARVVVWGPVELVRPIVDRRGAPPPLRRDVAELLRTSDSSRQLTLIGIPHFLFVGGQSLFAFPYRPLSSALQDFCGDRVSAASASLHVVDDRACYGELRFVTPVDLRSAARISLPERWRTLSHDVEDFLGRLERLDVFWRRVALRFDDMLDYLSRQTRMEFQRSQIVFNFYVPPTALHNLLLASELSLAAAGSGDLNADQEQPLRWTIQDALSQRVSLDIPQASLEAALEELVTQVNSALPAGQHPLVIRIAGEDLQQEGITRNQQVRDLQLADATVEEALTELARRANPVTDVTDLSDKGQKLVWIVAGEPDTNLPVILITTRTAAAGRGNNLPASFRAK